MDLLSAPLGIFDFAFTKLLPFIFVLTIVVFFHELGHFAVARWNKVRVETFAVGFGPELFGFFDKHKTRWKFCAIPLGGYVKFLGDEDASSKPNRDALESMSAEEREGAFEDKALWQKAAVVAAGPLANFILASVIYTGVFMYVGGVTIAPVVGAVTESSAAEEAGVQVGDLILKIEDDPISGFQDITRYTLISSGTPLKFTVERDGKELDLTIVPRMTKRKDRFGNVMQTGLVGIGSSSDPQHILRHQYGPIEAFTKSLDSIWLIVSRTYHFVRELVVGKQDASQLRGPLGIGQLTSQVATLGILQLITLAAALSVSIGLMNLLPIPVLDGGHLLFYAVQAIRGKEMSAKAQDIAFRIGLTCVLMLMLFATSNDILRFLGLSG